ncbi:hypothetical protein [Plasmodium yoelii yoelii]
MNNPW